MLYLFFPQKSYRPPALRDPALACVVYDDWQILVCKITKKLWNEVLYSKKTAKKRGFIWNLVLKAVPLWPIYIH